MVDTNPTPRHLTRPASRARTVVTLCLVSLVTAGGVSSGRAADCEGIPPESSENLRLELVASVSRPVDVQAIPGDESRLFVVDQNGRIRVVDLADDSLVTMPYLDISDRVRCCGERGLLGLAFHPEFATNGELFVYYSRSSECGNGGESVVSRFTASNPADATVSPGTEEILLTFCQPFSNHNGGQVRFSPVDGYLYISTGDGGSGGDPVNSGQTGTTMLGKLLRIDVDSQTEGLQYGIPASNPFIGNPNVNDEVWALGLRNPWRFDIDPENGDIYIGDVGQNAWEEIDWQPGASTGGENYEWRVIEGTHNFSAGTSFGAGTRVAPVFEYGHSSGQPRGASVTGGVVYRGCRMPDLQGTYFFGDYIANWVASLRMVEGEVSDFRLGSNELNNAAGAVSAFGRDATGELYVCNLSRSRVYRIVPGLPPNNPPSAVIATSPSPADVEIGGVPAAVWFDGSGSDDGDGGAQGLSYLWEQVAGPEGGGEIESPTSESTMAEFTQPGEYTYRLTVDDGRDTDSAEVPVTVRVFDPGFRRADVNGDLSFDLSDGVALLNALFAGMGTAGCLDAEDINDDGSVDVSDPVYWLNFLFAGGTVPPEPFDGCGEDLTPDDLDCDNPNCPPPPGPPPAGVP